MPARICRGLRRATIGEYDRPITRAVIAVRFMVYKSGLDLRVARRRAALTQLDCAHLLGTDQPRISKFETGTAVPTVVELSILYLLFDKSLGRASEEIIASLRDELERRRVMGLAIGSMKVGFAYLVDGELMDWKLSIDASRNEEAAYKQAAEWIGYDRLDVLVLEDPEHSRKGSNALLLHQAVMRAAVAAEVPVILMARPFDGTPNKYARAAYLANEFPQIRPWLPDARRLFDQEPRNIIMFEALSLCWGWWQSTSRGWDTELEQIDF